MMSLKVSIYSDYVCPFCFIGKDQLEKAIKETDIEVSVEWKTFELRPKPLAQLDPNNDTSKLSLWQQVIYPRIEAWDINMKLPNVSPHPYTDLAHEGFYYAKAHGKANDYNHRVYEAFFQEDQNIGEIEVLTQLAKEVGLNEDEFKDALVSRKYSPTRMKALEHANKEANITGVPTFIIGEERINGVVDKGTFEKVLKQESDKLKASGISDMRCSIDGGFC